jgi:hypothetical protein
MTVKLTQFITIVLVALVAGVFWGPWLGLSRSIDAFTPETFLAIGHTMIANLAPVMPVLMLLAAASQLVLAALMYRQRSTGLSAMAIGFVLFLVALLVTLLIEVPIDHQIKTWTLDALPVNWMELRDKWERFHKRTDRLDLGSLG